MSTKEEVVESTNRLNRYGMIIITKYLNTINDCINLEKTCKEYNGIMEQFKFNPVPLNNDNELKLFNNIETYHCYAKSEMNKKVENNMKINRIVHHENVRYSEWKEMKENDKHEFGEVEFTKDDMNDIYIFKNTSPVDLAEGCRRSKNEQITIEEGVTSLGEFCFFRCFNISSVDIPSSVTSIGDYCFYGLSEVYINIPKNLQYIGIDSFKCTKYEKEMNGYPLLPKKKKTFLTTSKEDESNEIKEPVNFEGFSYSFRKVPDVNLFTLGSSIYRVPLIMKFCYESYDVEGHPPNYVNLFNRIFSYKNKKHIFRLNDVYEQEGGEQLRHVSYPNSDIFLLCFSVLDKISLEWIEIVYLPEIRYYSKAPCVLVGVKTELREGEANEITYEEGVEKAKELGVDKYVECSWYSSKQINEVFSECIRIALDSKNSNKETIVEEKGDDKKCIIS